jgi:hypothetical protein
MIVHVTALIWPRVSTSCFEALTKNRMKSDWVVKNMPFSLFHAGSIGDKSG